MLRQIYIKLLIIALPLLGGLTSCITSGQERKILVIQSFEKTYKGYEHSEEIFVHYFKENGITPDINTFYLECESYQDKEEILRIYNYLDSISSWEPEIIIVMDDQATYSLLASKHPLIKEVPIVFSGVNFPNWELLKNYPNVTGFQDQLDFKKQAGMIDSIFGPMRVRVWVDDTFLGRKATRRLLEDLQSMGVDEFDNNKFELTDNGDYILSRDSMEVKTIEEKRMGLKKPNKMDFAIVESRNSTAAELLWVLSGMSRYSVYVLCKRDYTSLRLGLFTNSPTMTVINEGLGLGEGILGGYVTTLDTQFKQAVERSSEILKGKNVQELPITQSPKEYIMDWNEMKRWGITINQIPAGTRIVNMPFFERYRVYLISGGTFFGFLIILTFSYLLALYLRENKNKRLAENKLRKGERFLSLALTGGKVFAFQIKDGVLTFDSNFYHTIGMEERPISMDEFRSIISPEDRPSFNQRINAALNGSVVQRIGQGRYNFNGSGYQWWEFRYAYSEEDQVVCGLCMNIQQLKEAEEGLIHARQRAEEADRMKSAFLANMSHEIRTPLNAIVGFSNLINMEDMELSAEEKRGFLELINTNCDLLLKLINDILDLSRIESGKMDFIFAENNLNDLMDNVYRTHRLLMPDNVELQLRIPEEPVMLNTDRHRLTQVVTNFINNAAKFTEKGYIRIGYELTVDKTAVDIYVEDTGRGIPEDQLNAVFERFNKLNEFAQGTGLGLAICKVIVERFHGSINLQSKEGVGSKFTITLPIIN